MNKKDYGFMALAWRPVSFEEFVTKFSNVVEIPSNAIGFSDSVEVFKFSDLNGNSAYAMRAKGAGHVIIGKDVVNSANRWSAQ